MNLDRDLWRRTQRRLTAIVVTIVLGGILGAPQATPGFAQTPQPPPVPRTIFGADIRSFSTDRPGLFDYAQKANLTWVRYEVTWEAAVDPRPAGDGTTRGETYLRAVEAELRRLTAAGMTPTVFVQRAPMGKRLIPIAPCSPPANPDDFAAFMRDRLVPRLRLAGVRYWILWNEPDVDPALLWHDGRYRDMGIGCWGDAKDFYYGGRSYGEMVRVVAPAIKAADPAAQVVLGGLLLDCDPNNPPPDYGECRTGRFLEGVLVAGAGAHLDATAFSSYAHRRAANRVDWSIAWSNWGHNGGALVGKLQFVRSLLRSYGLRKPVLVTEAALTCRTANCSDPAPGGYLDDQANYIVRLYIRALANGVLGVQWYALTGGNFFESDLIDPATNRPRPGYTALRAVAGRIGNASIVQQLSSGELEAYLLIDPATRTEYRVYWTNSSATRQVRLPPQGVQIFDKLGNPLTTSGETLDVGFDPVIVQSRGLPPVDPETLPVKTFLPLVQADLP